MYFLEEKYQNETFFTGSAHREGWKEILFVYLLVRTEEKVFRITSYVNENQRQEIIRFYFKNNEWIVDPNYLHPIFRHIATHAFEQPMAEGTQDQLFELGALLEMAQMSMIGK